MNTDVIYNARTPPSAGTHLSAGLRVQEWINDARPASPMMFHKIFPTIHHSCPGVITVHRGVSSRGAEGGRGGSRSVADDLAAVFPEASPRKPTPWRVNCRETSPFFPSLPIINQPTVFWTISLKTSLCAFFWSSLGFLAGFSVLWSFWFSKNWRSEVFVKSRFLFFFFLWE